MPKTLDLTGQRFGRLTVLSRAGSAAGPAQWRCRCECESLLVVWAVNLKAGRTKSCGCLRKDALQALLTTHGFCSHPLFATWQGMVKRCQDPKNSRYDDYGGRGIKCLLKSPMELADQVGPRPSPQHTVDRYPNNDGHYEPGNLRWATRKEQQRNRRNNRILTWQGKSQCVALWSEELGMSQAIIHSRIYRGWTDERILSTPIRSRK
jgi:hypothetical protein